MATLCGWVQAEVGTGLYVFAFSPHFFLSGSHPWLGDILVTCCLPSSRAKRPRGRRWWQQQWITSNEGRFCTGRCYSETIYDIISVHFIENMVSFCVPSTPLSITCAQIIVMEIDSENSVLGKPQSKIHFCPFQFIWYHLRCVRCKGQGYLVPNLQKVGRGVCLKSFHGFSFFSNRQAVSQLGG